MMIAIPDKEWIVFNRMSLKEFTEILVSLANNIDLEKFKKHKRGPKKVKVKRKLYSGHPHVSTAKLLQGNTP